MSQEQEIKDFSIYKIAVVKILRDKQKFPNYADLQIKLGSDVFRTCVTAVLIADVMVEHFKKNYTTFHCASEIDKLIGQARDEASKIKDDLLAALKTDEKVH